MSMMCRSECRGGPLEHDFGEVDANEPTRVTDVLGGGEQDLAGPRRHVEDAVATAHPGELHEPSCVVGEVAGPTAL